MRAQLFFATVFLAVSSVAGMHALHPGNKPPPETPHLFILGAANSATQAVNVQITLLSLMSVCGPNERVVPRDREFHFFDKALSVPVEEHGVPLDQRCYLDGKGCKSNETVFDQYRRAFFGGYGCDRFLDTSPSLLRDVAAPGRMATLMPSSWKPTVRMLVILREPGSRDLSAYNAVKSLWWDIKQKQAKGDITEEMEQFSAHVERHMCSNATTNESFPSYATATGCLMRDWRERCEAGSSNLSEAFSRCAANADLGYLRQDESYNRLSDGIYLPQLLAYTRYFKRSQMLIMDFDQLIQPAKQELYLQTIVRFYGLPYSEHASELTSLQRENANDFPGKVRNITCEVQEALGDVYRSSNSELYAWLAQSHADKSAPVKEPIWPATPDLWAKPPCGDAEVLFGKTKR